MHLVEILLPLRDNAGREFPPGAFDFIKGELTSRFGGLTAFARAPADGFWRNDAGATVAEEVIALEVMTAAIDEEWWRGFRESLEALFRQQEIVIRAHEIQRL